MTGPAAALLGDGSRLHLQHGPIDLIIGADPAPGGDRARAFAAAARRFDGLLEALVAELPLLRAEMTPDAPRPAGPVARRMHRAALPHCGDVFVTRMAAVAGAVADEILAAMVKAEPLSRAYVNDGGDIAFYLARGEEFTAAMAGVEVGDLGRIVIRASDRIGGIATSGRGGRSLSFGIADSVTVLARTAAEADVAATLIANAVDLPGHPEILHSPASSLQPDSDLGDRLVVTAVGTLYPAEIEDALLSGAKRARDMMCKGQIAAAALFLRDQQMLVGRQFQLETH